MAAAPMSIEHARVVVIGGTSGIGFAVAALAQQMGADVEIASSHADRVNTAVERLPGVTGHRLDLRDEGSVSRFFDVVGPFDHLVVTAGDWDTPLFGGTRDIDLAAARDAFEVRFWGALAAVKHGVRSIHPNGSITLTSGTLAHRPMKAAPLASAVVGAVEHLARGLAVDLAPVRVNVVCPGPTLTEHTKQLPMETLQAFISPLPLPGGAAPEEAAMAYVYSMMNTYVTGQVLLVDGGGSLI